MAVYQKAAESFGDDNFVFLVYDDPELLTPAGMDRVAELAAAVGPDADPGRAAGRVARRHAACSGRSTTPCSRSTGCPRSPASWRLNAAQADGQEPRPEDERDDGQRRRPRGATPQALAALKDRLTQHPLFRGTLIDATATTTAVVVRLTKTARARRHRDRRGPPRDRPTPSPRGTSWRGRPWSGRRCCWPTASRHRDRRPAAGGRRHDPDRRW